MRDALRRLFRPLLEKLESGDEPYHYKPSHRTVLLVVGGLFFFLSSLSIYLALFTAEAGGLVPSIFFFLVGCVSLVIGVLGSDRAVAKLWGSR